MASTTTPADDYTIEMPVASSAMPMVAFPNRPSEPPEMSAFRDRNQPPSSNGAEAGGATTPPSAPANQGGDEQRIRKYKLGLVSLGLLAAVAIIAAAVTKGVDRPDSSTDLTSAPLPPLMIPTSAPVASVSAPLIWKQQGEPIVGAAENDEFGYSVAMSADSKTLVVGAIGSNDNTGYVKVYHANDDGSSSMQLLGQIIIGDAVDDYFGNSVSVSSDGKTVAIGAPEYLNNRPGYVRVFYLESDGLGSSWNQLGQDITGDADGDRFGVFVSLSGDGKTLAAGASNHDENGVGSGCVRIYHLEDDGTNWEQIGQDIYGEAAGDESGHSVSLSADGTTVAIGAHRNDGNGDRSGHVRVYQIDSAGSTWEQLGQDINGEAVDDNLGWSVDISPDGRTLAIGAPGYYGVLGFVRVYYLESNDLTSSWKQLGQDIIGEAIADLFGYSVSLSDDGKTLAIGAINNDGNGSSSGHVRVYRMDDSSTSWTQVGEDIDGEDGFDNSGFSVSLSADGTTVAIGAPENDCNGSQSGHVRIFSITSAPLPPLMIPTSAPVASVSAPLIWKQQGEPIVGDAEKDLFGYSVAMSADSKTLVVGASGYDNTGYVKVYHMNDDGSSLMQLIGQSIFGEDDNFGCSVSISSDGKILAIGSPGYWYYRVNDRPGYVQVFYLKSDGLGSSWNQLGQDITGDADGDQFGISVSLSSDGKTLAVGASNHDGNGESWGCVRIYRLEDNGTNWEQIGQDFYGETAYNYIETSVSLSADGKTVAIGAPWYGHLSGQVRVYQIDSAGSTWEQLGQDINGEAVGDEFGWSVDISPDGRTLAIGAPLYRSELDRTGYVRVYYLESNDLISSWKQLGQDIIGEAIGDLFGYSVSLSGDGKTLAIGAPENDENGVDSGHVRVYRMDDSSMSWTQLGEDIDGEASYDNSGFSVSLSADGTTVAIGAPGNDCNGLYSGHVRIFSIK